MVDVPHGTVNAARNRQLLSYACIKPVGGYLECRVALNTSHNYKHRSMRNNPFPSNNAAQPVVHSFTHPSTCKECAGY
eukprot:1157664-Pelagomonas_calceolata.AAC.2